MIEILVGSIILTIGMLGMAGLTTTVIQGNLFSNKVTTATTLSQDKLEDIRRQGYNSTLTVNTTTTEDYNSISGFEIYKRVTVIAVNSPAAGMQTVTVTVFWNSDTQSVGLQSIVTQ
jgi:Tfp pilus assembly protein PilV